MKRLILSSLLTISFVILSYSQDLMLPKAGEKIPSGPYNRFVMFNILKDGHTYVNSDNTEYLVYSFKDKTASELYNSAKTVLSQIYKNPSRVLSTTENVSIVVKARESSLFKIYDSYFGIGYSFTILFKDGKIRINAPYISEIVEDDEIEGVDLSVFNEVYHFFKNNKVERIEQVNDINVFLEDWVKSFISRLKNLEDEW